MPEKVSRTATNAKRMHLLRRSPDYWRVTLHHPPLNIFGPESMPQLNEVITALETDKDVKVVVFDSAVEGFLLTHYDFLANSRKCRSKGAPWPKIHGILVIPKK